MANRNLGLDELMIVNPGPVGARPCRFAPLRPLEGAHLGCDCQTQGSRQPPLLLGEDGIVYRAVGRAVPMGPRTRTNQR